MKMQDIQINDFFRPAGWDGGDPPTLQVKGIVGAAGYDYNIYISQDGDEVYDIYGLEDLEGVPITTELLERNGWQLKGGIYVLKANPRLGWYPKTKQLIAGYASLGVEIEFVHQLQHLLRLFKIKDPEL